MVRSLLRPILQLVWRLQALRFLFLAATYGTVLTWCIWMSYQLRFDFNVPFSAGADLLSIGAVTVGIQLLSLVLFHQFDGLLTYFSTPDLKRLIGACTGSSLVLGVFWLAGGLESAPPRGVILTDYVLCIVALSATRFIFRYGRRLTSTRRSGSGRKARRVAIVGAGDSGAALARDLLAKPWLALRPVAFFDDHRKTHSSVHGIPVVGRPERMGELSRWLRLEEVIIAMPSAPPKRIRDVVKLIQDAGLPCRTVPSLDQLATGRVNVSVLRPVEIQDLLGRAPVHIQVAEVWRSLRGRTVMVTGAGGSIGSELCRQILTFGPDKLLLVERSEPQLFLIEQELRAMAADVVEALVGDVTRRDRMREIFRRFQPDVIFHAAAHKHVPMMESQPEEAIRNNIFGTAQLADLAVEYGVEHFVLISTDKAVNPTNVMGATKRVAELYLQVLAADGCATKFQAVRFGNVLGSSGSVVPTFTRQIAEGGPVTVTHPEITRFFMTIPEAVTLVLQSSAFGQSGDIHVLDMGKPVKIVDLAVQMIALSGFTPHQDIEIVFTGLRPGEKLYEELSHGSEKVTTTEHPKIMRLVSPPMPQSDIKLFLADLADALDDGVFDPATLKELLATMVPEYTPFHPAAPPAPPVHLPAEPLACAVPAL